MATRSSTLDRGTGPAVIRIRPAAALGAALLAAGLMAGVFIGQARQTAGTDVAAKPQVVETQAAPVPMFEDYGIRHADEYASTVTSVGPLEDYGIRHGDEYASTVTEVGPHEDYGIRHPEGS